MSNLKSSKNNQLIYGENFYNITLEYINKIELLSYKGIPQFKRITLSPKEKLIFKIKKNYLGFKNYELGTYNMKIPVKEKIFFLETKKYLNKIFNFNKKNIKNKKLILDQATNFWNPLIVNKFFENPKIIVVTRDPRSIFYSMKSRQSFAYPGYDIKTFCCLVQGNYEKKKYIKKNIKIIF